MSLLFLFTDYSHLLSQLLEGEKPRGILYTMTITGQIKRETMSLYIAERPLSEVSLEELSGILKALTAMSQRYTAEGRPVRVLQSIIVLSEARCMNLFETDSPITVRDIHEAAQVPFTRIIEVAVLKPADKQIEM